MINEQSGTMPAFPNQVQLPPAGERECLPGLPEGVDPASRSAGTGRKDGIPMPFLVGFVLGFVVGAAAIGLQFASG